MDGARCAHPTSAVEESYHGYEYLHPFRHTHIDNYAIGTILIASFFQTFAYTAGTFYLSLFYQVRHLLSDRITYLV